MAEPLLEIPASIVEEALDLELEAGEVVADEVDGRRCIFLAGLHRAERAIADRLSPDLLDQMRDIEVVEITCAEQPDLLLDPQAEVALVEPAPCSDLRLRARHALIFGGRPTGRVNKWPIRLCNTWLHLVQLPQAAEP
jgi:hypothetical protein